MSDTRLFLVSYVLGLVLVWPVLRALSFALAVAVVLMGGAP